MSKVVFKIQNKGLTLILYYGIMVLKYQNTF